MADKLTNGAQLSDRHFAGGIFLNENILLSNKISL